MSDEYPIQPATWADIENAAHHSPYLHALVTLVRGGSVTREQGLMAAALALSKANAARLEQLGYCLSRCQCGAANAAISAGSSFDSPAAD